MVGLRDGAALPVERFTADQYQQLQAARERLGLGHLGQRRRERLAQMDQTKQTF